MTFIREAERIIRETGGRMTAQRELIIRLLDSATDMLDAEALYLLAHQHDESVSLATVYRTLNTLEEAKLIQQRYVSKDHTRKYYELIHAEEAYHFTCRHCQKIIPFQTKILDALKKDLENQLGVRNLMACVCVSGICPDCLATYGE